MQRGWGLLLVGCGRIMWKIIPFSNLRSIWKERNDTVFKRKELTLENLISTAGLRVAKWASVRKDCSGLKIENILHNWEPCLRMGFLKEKRKVSWCPSPPEVLNFNVDGAARGKPGLASIRGVLRNQKY